ncbi:MAG: hypothetical protein ACO1SX_05270 [Actinomycetota bacterium]
MSWLKKLLGREEPYAVPPTESYDYDRLRGALTGGRDGSAAYVAKATRHRAAVSAARSAEPAWLDTLAFSSLRVSDEAGCLALVDPDAYHGYAGAKGDLRDHLAKFGEQMAARRLLLWGTGEENRWDVRVSRQYVGDLGGYQEATGPIVASAGRLLLASVETLLVAGRSPEPGLYCRSDVDPVIEVKPGAYQCRIIQLRWADDLPLEDQQIPHFVIELTPMKESLQPWKSIPWSDLQPPLDA